MTEGEHLFIGFDQVLNRNSGQWEVLNLNFCFLSHLSRDLMSWINGIRGLVSSEEMAKDVTGAEALLERHQVLESHWGAQWGWCPLLVD